MTIFKKAEIFPTFFLPQGFGKLRSHFFPQGLGKLSSFYLGFLGFGLEIIFDILFIGKVKLKEYNNLKQRTNELVYFLWKGRFSLRSGQFYYKLSFTSGGLRDHGDGEFLENHNLRNENFISHTDIGFIGKAQATKTGYLFPVFLPGPGSTY